MNWGQKPTAFIALLPQTNRLSSIHVSSSYCHLFSLRWYLPSISFRKSVLRSNIYKECFYFISYLRIFTRLHTLDLICYRISRSFFNIYFCSDGISFFINGHFAKTFTSFISLMLKRTLSRNTLVITKTFEIAQHL